MYTRNRRIRVQTQLPCADTASNRCWGTRGLACETRVEDRLLPHFFWSLGHFENFLTPPPNCTVRGFSKGGFPPFARGIEGGAAPSPSKKNSELMRFIDCRKRLRWKAGTLFHQKRARLLASLVPNFRENCSPFRLEEGMAGS